jgi:hypothetical protein
MTNNSGMLQHRSSPPFSQIIVGNGASLPITIAGSSTNSTPYTSLAIRNILFSRDIVKNLVFVRAFTRDNFVSVEFDPFGFSVKDLRRNAVIFQRNGTGNLYPIRFSPQINMAASTVSVDLWYRRLGHPGQAFLSTVLHSFPFSCNKSANHVCHACQLGKHTRLPFSNASYRTHFPFQPLHSDVWTSPIPNNSGYTYYLVILDDYSHYVWTFPITIVLSCICPNSVSTTHSCITN